MRVRAREADQRVAPAVRPDWTLWRRWVAVTTAGELAGFCAPAVAGAVAYRAGLDEPATLGLLVAAGFVEGLALGTAQGWVLARVLPGLSRRGFALATGAAAAFAYVLGMLPSSLGDRLAAVPVVVLVAGSTAAALALLASIGTAQWLVLRRQWRGRPWWIVTTAGAWLAGLAVFLLVATPLWHPGQALLATVTIGVFAGALMAATVAALTGFAVLRLARHRWARPPLNPR